MTQTRKVELAKFMDELKARTPHQSEFHQAVHEVVTDVLPLVNESAEYRDGCVLQRLVEPDRQITFRVTWEDDRQQVHVNRGYRVQFNSALGPYKGGLRFHPSVNSSILKFLGFEQTFKNALTGLPMGGGKGGADFDPSGCSASEIRRFCMAYMTELYRHIGADTDIPAGDINVGAREIGYLFGAYRQITNQYTSVLTGKGLCYGGSEMRREATGYGLLHFVDEMLKQHDNELEGQTVVVSGAGNVATHAAEKALQMGAKVVSLSDSNGTLHDANGLTQEKIDWVREHKSESGTSLEAYTDEFDASWHAEASPWQIPCDICLPCATQNELDADGVQCLLNNGCTLIAEGANMPVVADARKRIADSGILYAPGKATNAGGVAMSGLEISQNRHRRSRSREKLQNDLQSIMRDIHARCVDEGISKDGKVNYATAANIASFRTVAEAMLAQGLH